VVFLAGEYASRPPTDFAEVPGRPGRYYAQKLLVLVRARVVATVVVPSRDRAHFALLYDRSKFDVPYRLGYRIAGGDPAVRFRACPQDHPVFHGRGTVGAWTEFNGGVIVAGARCAELAVLVPGRTKAILRFLAFGVDRSACRPGQTRSRG
jgi:hypothetical protein